MERTLCRDWTSITRSRNSYCHTWLLYTCTARRAVAPAGRQHAHPTTVLDSPRTNLVSVSHVPLNLGLTDDRVAPCSYASQGLPRAASRWTRRLSDAWCPMQTVPWRYLQSVELCEILLQKSADHLLTDSGSTRLRPRIPDLTSEMSFSRDFDPWIVGSVFWWDNFKK